MFDLGLKLAFGVLDVFVTFHSVCFTRTGLTVGEKSSVVAVHYLGDHAFDTDLLVEGSLIDLAVTHFVKLICLWLFVSSVILETYIIPVTIDNHLTRCVRRCPPRHD